MNLDFSGVKLIAADMDGTLLNSKHELDESFYGIFSALRAKGIYFSAASGRQYYNIFNQFSRFHEDIIFIAENGSYVVHDGKELLVQAMEPDVTRDLLRRARQIDGVNLILCGRKTAYIENTSEDFVSKLDLYYDKVEVVSDLIQVENDDFLKIAICDLKGSEQNSYHTFQQFESQLQVKISGKIWLDLSHKLANKGRALQRVQQTLGIKPSETMAFGDFLNDMEMLQEAAFSFAMANAHEAVKKVARYVADTNDEGGVFKILSRMV